MVIGFLLAALFSFSTLAGSAQMITPRNGVTLALKSNAVRFTWNEIDPTKEYVLELMSQNKNAKPIKVKVRGNTHLVNFKHLPPTLYWRVYPKSESNPKSIEPFKVNLRAKTKWDIGADIGYVQTHARLKSSEVGQTQNLTGPMVELKAFYSPAKWRKLVTGFFFRNIQLSDGDSELNEMRLAAEVGQKLTSTYMHSQTIFLIYQFYNQQKYTFKDSSTATYDVQFLGAHYNYTRRLTEKWNTSLDLHLLSPTQFNVRPSFTLRPQIGRQINQRWRADGFLQFENYYSKPKDSDLSNVTVQLQHLSAGVGMTYQY